MKLINSSIIENLPRNVEQIKKDLMNFNESVLNSFMFETVFLLTTQNSKAHKTRNIASKYSKEKWKEAFEKSKGDVDKAYKIYTKDSYFC